MLAEIYKKYTGVRPAGSAASSDIGAALRAAGSRGSALRLPVRHRLRTTGRRWWTVRGYTLWLSVGAFVLGLRAGRRCCVFPRVARFRPVRVAVRSMSRSSATRRSWCSSSSSTSRCPRSASGSTPTRPRCSALALNFGGYATEILRSGIEAVPRGQIEAATALGLRPAAASSATSSLFPARAGQSTRRWRASSSCCCSAPPSSSAISAEELTAITNSLQSTTFRSFEFYFVATLIYLAMARAARLVLDALYWAGFVRGRPPLRGAGMSRRLRAPPELLSSCSARCAGRSLLSLVAFVGGGVGGLVIALMRISRATRCVRWVARVYIGLFQGTPLLMQLFLAYLRAGGADRRPARPLARGRDRLHALRRRVPRRDLARRDRGDPAHAMGGRRRARAAAAAARCGYVILPQALRGSRSRRRSASWCSSSRARRSPPSSASSS